jgi:hypothetical protein
MTHTWLLRTFYAVVLLVALAGQTIAATTWLHWPLVAALVAVAAVELGGVALSAHADARRQLGERALAARLLSAGVAAGAVAVNWLGHADHLQGGFFAGMSALGYTVWLVDSAARRRDQLRRARMLPPAPPAYPWRQWLRHPLLTARARELALADPTLGLYRSLEEARAAIRRERRQAAIAKVLHRKVRAAVDPTMADIAVAVYDLDEVAARLAGAADYDGFTSLIAAELAAPRVAGVTDTRPDITADITPAADTAVTSSSADPTRDDKAGEPASRPKLAKDQAQLVAQSIYLANPDIDLATIADIVERDVRTVRRYLAPIGGPTSTPPNTPTPAPPRILDPAEALAQLDTVVDPIHRRHLAALALFGSDIHDVDQVPALTAGAAR